MADDADNRCSSGGISPHLIAATDEARASRRRHAPAAARNAGPILAVLKGCLPETGNVLEIGSGTGQHAVAFARAFPGLQWWPSDPDAGARDSIAAWRDETGLASLRAPLDLDVMLEDWHIVLKCRFEAVLAVNLVHISPWAATEGLMRGAGILLAPGGILLLYGPYRRDGVHTADSNATFEHWLKSENPDWGVRDLEHVEREAGMHGLRLDDVVPMPANNFSLIFRKR